MDPFPPPSELAAPEDDAPHGRFQPLSAPDSRALDEALLGEGSSLLQALRPRSGLRSLVFRLALERTRAPLCSAVLGNPLSVLVREALKTLHDAVFPPRGW